MTNNSIEEVSNQPERLTNSKAVITYLAECFPACFSTDGDAHPLKIGIFDDLASRLADDEKVSKTRLRTALRQYTSSWRYLRSVKAGVARVDLDGKEAGIVEADHEQHAQETLQASRERAQKERKDKNPPKAAPRKPKSNVNKPRAKPVKPKSAVKTEEPKVSMKEMVDPKALKIGQRVSVKLGKSPVIATVTTIDKTEAQVQLDTGMTLKVPMSELHHV